MLQTDVSGLYNRLTLRLINNSFQFMLPREYNFYWSCVALV